MNFLHNLCALSVCLYLSTSFISLELPTGVGDAPAKAINIPKIYLNSAEFWRLHCEFFFNLFSTFHCNCQYTAFSFSLIFFAQSSIQAISTLYSLCLVFFCSFSVVVRAQLSSVMSIVLDRTNQIKSIVCHHTHFGVGSVGCVSFFSAYSLFIFSSRFS